MKKHKETTNDRYEYNSLIAIKEQVEGYYLSRSSLIRCPNGCHDFYDG